MAGYKLKSRWFDRKADAEDFISLFGGYYETFITDCAGTARYCVFYKEVTQGW